MRSKLLKPVGLILIDIAILSAPLSLNARFCLLVGALGLYWMAHGFTKNDS